MKRNKTGVNNNTLLGFAMFYAVDADIQQVSLSIDSMNIGSLTSTPLFPQIFSSDILLSDILTPGTHTITYEVTGLPGVSYPPITSTFVVIPVPSSVVLGGLGLIFSGWLLKSKRMA